MINGFWIYDIDQGSTILIFDRNVLVIMFLLTVSAKIEK